MSTYPPTANFSAASTLIKRIKATKTARFFRHNKNAETTQYFSNTVSKRLITKRTTATKLFDDVNSSSSSSSSSSFYADVASTLINNNSEQEALTTIIPVEEQSTSLNCTSCNVTDVGMAFDPSLLLGEQIDFLPDCAWSGWEVIDIVLFVIGTFGNVFSLILMRRRGLRSRSYALSLSVLALFNSLTLFVLAVQAADRLVQKHFNNASLESHIGTIGCKFYRIVLAIVQLMSHWAVVFITTERFVAIWYPMALSTLFSATSSRITMGCLFTAVILAESWRPFFDYQEPGYFKNESNNTQVWQPAQCSATNFHTFLNIDLFFHQLLMLCLIPAILILVMNSAVILKVYQMGREIRKAGGFHRGGQSVTSARATVTSDCQPPHHAKWQSVRDSGNSRSRKTTMLLLTVSCSFFFHITPFLVMIIYIRILHLVKGAFAGHIAFANLCQPLKVANLWTGVSYADNFLIFILAGEKFRRELRLIFFKILTIFCPKHFDKIYRQEMIRSSRSTYSQSESTSTMASRNRVNNNCRRGSSIHILASNTLITSGAEPNGFVLGPPRQTGDESSYLEPPRIILTPPDYKSTSDDDDASSIGAPPDQTLLSSGQQQLEGERNAAEIDDDDDEVTDGDDDNDDDNNNDRLCEETAVDN